MKKRITIDGIEVAYTVSGGSGLPVILMHGWGCSSDTVKSISNAICDRFKVYSIDLPGFGDSSEPFSTWGSIDYCYMVEKFSKALSITHPILIGHSFGGKVSIHYAARNNTNRVVLVGSAGVKPRHSLKWHIKVKSYKLAKKILPLLLGKKRGWEIIDSFRKSSASADYNASSAMMQSILIKVVGEDLREQMSMIKAPSLLMWGEKDSATPLRDAHIMERYIKNSGLVIFDGAGHYSFLDQPYKFSVVLNKFLE